MKLRSAFLILFILLSSLLIAQKNPGNFTLTGSVSDLMTNKPLTGVSVIVLSRPTGKELKGMASDAKGNFKLENIPESIVRVRLSMVGYQTQVIDSVNLDKSSRLGLIMLLPTTVDMPEVVVKSLKPMIEFHADKQVVNIDRVPGNSGSVTETLRNTGLVDVDPQSSAISIRGQGVKLQMDGHDYTMPSEMLDKLPASMLDQVEVVLAPGAKESAEGGTYILNLITKKSTFNNTSGMISLSAGTNKNSGGGLYFNHKTGSINIFGQAYANYFEFNSRTQLDRYVYTSPSMYYQGSSNENGNTYRTGYFKLGFDYDIDDKNSITFYSNYNGYNYFYKNNGLSYVYNQDNVFQYSYFNSNNTDYSSNNLSFYGFYKKKFSTKGNELNFDIMYTVIGNPQNDNMNLGYSNLPNAPKLQNSTTDIKAKTLIFKTDYSLPFKEDKFEAGYNFTRRVRNNDYNVQNYSYSNKTWLDSLALSNQFEYTETINALYASYAYKLDKLEAKLGIRAENLSTHGNQMTQGILFDENYLSLFPNLNVMYKFSDLFQLGFNTFRRVNYPQIYYLNPFRQNQGPNSFYAGNPNLKPNYINSYAINLSQFLSVYYTHTTGDFTSARTVENDSVIVSSYINLNSQDTFGFNFTLPYNNTPMSPVQLPEFINSFNISFNYRYYKQSGQFVNQDLSMTDKTYTFNANMNLKLWYDITAGIYLYYRPKTENKLQINSESKYLSIYFSKTFFDRKLRLNISANDILNNQKRSYVTIGNGYYTSYNNESLNSRSFSIGISYFINDYKNRQERNIDDGRDAGNRSGGNP